MGQGLRTSRYTVNSLNQYTQRTVPGAVDVLGEAAADAVVTVNDQDGVPANGEAMRKGDGESRGGRW